ncbi:MAG: GNAT family acetyltransferase [Granulosicoccaceae bacterium]
MQIRAFEKNDTQAVVDLWREVGLTRDWNDPHRDIERKLQIQPELFLVAVDDQQRVLGTLMAGYTGFRGWINYMAVKSEHQSSGIGRELMMVARQKLLAMGCAKINLQVRQDNEQVVQFYKSIGFSEDPVLSMGMRLIED